MRTPPLILFASLAALVALLALTACETTSTSPTPSPTSPSAAAASPRRPTHEPGWISFERTRTDSGAAPGPVYTVTLFEDGKVIFEGYAQVKSKGTFSRTIPREQAALIFAEMETINLWDRPRRYDVERANRGGDEVIVRSASTEVSWDILRARRVGRMIRIDGLFFAPSEILRLKENFERTVGLAAFIGPPSEWQR